MFTGSTATGKKVMERAARTLTPVGARAGRQGPDDRAAPTPTSSAPSNAAVYYSMQNAGQTCISTERVYVEEPIYDEFVRLVTEKVNALRQGAPGGPGIDRPRRGDPSAAVGHRRARTWTDAVRARRARAHRRQPPRRATGTTSSPRCWSDVDHSMECMREETFGPTVPIMRVRDADEAVRLANDSPLRPAGVGVDEGRRARASGSPRRHRGRGGHGQRRADQLRRARAADGRLEGVRPRHAPRRGRHPQVHEEADPARHEASRR